LKTTPTPYGIDLGREMRAARQAHLRRRELARHLMAAGAGTACTLLTIQLLSICHTGYPLLAMVFLALIVAGLWGAYYRRRFH
jgi:hypothetical protein